MTDVTTPITLTGTIDLTTLAAAVAPLVAAINAPAPPATPAAPTQSPGIASFSPASGPAGTVVTVSGVGFTGVTTAWMGAAQKDVAFKIISDTQIQLTVPADATTGLIALENAKGWGFSASNFTVSLPVSTTPPVVVTPPTTPPATTTGPTLVPVIPFATGTPVTPKGLGVTVSGKNFLDANGKVLKLIGGCFSGLEFVAAQGWDPNDPWGGTALSCANFKSWGWNCVRVCVNAASLMGNTCGLTTGTGATLAFGASRSADPGKNYRQALDNFIIDAEANGMRVIIVMHWSAPNLTLNGVTMPLMPLGQNVFLDHDQGYAAWQYLIGRYGTAAPAILGIDSAAILFEWQNEPFIDYDGGTLSAGSADAALLNGGTATITINSTQNGSNYNINQTVKYCGYQELFNLLRAGKHTNIGLVAGNSWSQNLKNYTAWKPVDSLNQFAFAVHCYGSGTWPYSDGNIWCKTGTDPGGGTSACRQWANAIMAAGYPVIATEDSGYFGPGYGVELHVKNTCDWSDATGASVLMWQANNPQAVGSKGQNYLIVGTAAAIAPSPGVGQTFHDWGAAKLAA